MIEVKICGLCDRPAVDAAIEGGARYAGFVFYPKSPRAVAAEQAAALIATIPEKVTPVGLFVDPGDDDLVHVLRITPLRMLQLHGHETIQRVAAIKQFTGLPIIKAVGIDAMQDIDRLRAYEPVADILMGDAKPPAGGLPGGNAVSFDWKLLQGVSFARPWMLAGGLNADNIAGAVETTGARLLDVSSGVEDVPGHKNPQKIKDFLAKAGNLLLR